MGSVMQFQWYKDGNQIEGANNALLVKSKAGFATNLPKVLNLRKVFAIDNNLHHIHMYTAALNAPLN